MDIDEALRGYFANRKKIESCWGDPVALADKLLRIATYGTYIADELGSLKAQYEHERAAAYRKYLNEGKSASGAENLARSDTAELRGSIDKIELVYKALGGLVNMGQSQLRVLSNERNTGGLQT